MSTTFQIVRGVKTNRVKRVRAAYRDRFDPATQRAVAKFRAQPDHAVGVPYTATTISLPVADLVGMDELADELGVSRSRLIRDAVKAYREKVGGQ